MVRLLVLAQSVRSLQSSALSVHILLAERRECAVGVGFEAREDGPGGGSSASRPVPDQIVRASSAQAFTGLYCEPPKPRTRYMMGANSQSSTPKPPPWPKFLATSMQTMSP